MKRNLKSKVVGLSTLALAGTVLPNVTSCSDPTSMFFTVKGKDLEVEFCDMGASIYSIKYKDTYLTYHPQDRDTFIDKEATPYYYGKALGRVAGRFADGKFSIDGTEYTAQVNEKGTTKNNFLHGGTDAFSFKVFNRWVTENDDYTKVAFNYVSPAMEAGFPESIDAWIVYTLYKKENKIDTDLFAKPSGKTVINLSTHSLFRLGNSGNVLNYNLQIPTDIRAQYDKEDSQTTNQVVVGTIDVESEQDGIFDFQQPKKIGDVMSKIKEYDPISGGIDHIWVFDRDTEISDRYVKVQNPDNGITFKVTANTDSVDGFIIYTNCYPRKGQIMSDGKEDTLYSGITVEPYTYFTKGDISSITYTPDKPFYNSYTYEVSEEE